MVKYPLYLDLSGKLAVVIGAGNVAARKVQALAPTGARIVVVAPDADENFRQACGTGDIELIIGKYSKDHLAEAVLAIAATDDLDLNKRIYADCQELKVICNVVDQPELCDFYVPALVQRGHLQIAIGTDGNCPAYAGHVRRKLEGIFTEDHGRFVDELEKIRKHIIAEIADLGQRKAVLVQLVKDDSFDRFLKDGPDQWQQWAKEVVSQQAG